MLERDKIYVWKNEKRTRVEKSSSIPLETKGTKSGKREKISGVEFKKQRHHEIVGDYNNDNNNEDDDDDEEDDDSIFFSFSFSSSRGEVLGSW